LVKVGWEVLKVEGVDVKGDPTALEAAMAAGPREGTLDFVFKTMAGGARGKRRQN
jgi:hypothetical protein